MATSNGTIVLFRVNADALSIQTFEEISSLKVAEPSILVLSLAWCPLASEAGRLAASLSNGSITVVDCTDNGNEMLFQPTKCHDLEAWTVAWSPAHPSKQLLLISGGDDSAISFLGVNADPPLSNDTSKSVNESPVQRDRKTHGAGVTAVLPLATTATCRDQIVITGSYDEFVRVVTPPKSSYSSRWGLLAEKRLGGGVWRLKLMSCLSLQSSNTYLVLASCMHAGAKILIISGSTATGWTIEVTAIFGDHESMNYASDARIEHGETGAQQFTVVSTSFYDRKVCVWRCQGLRDGN